MDKNHSIVHERRSKTWLASIAPLVEALEQLNADLVVVQVGGTPTKMAKAVIRVVDPGQKRVPHVVDLATLMKTMINFH